MNAAGREGSKNFRGRRYLGLRGVSVVMLAMTLLIIAKVTFGRRVGSA